MLPARFEYHRPSTLAEALSLLAQYGDDAKVLAGGMSLIPLMKLRFASPEHLIDINHIPELQGMEESDGALRIGAVTRHAILAGSDLLKRRSPTIASAAPQIADPVVRNLGTIGGSLAHADPAGDLGSVLIAQGAEVVARSADGERTIPAHDLFVSNFQSSLEPGEILTEVRIPSPEAMSGGTYLKLERKVGDFATVGVAVSVSMDDGRVGRAGIGLTAVGPTNIRAREAEESLAGAEASDEAFAEAGRLAAEAAQPTTDVRGSAEYKRHVVDVYVRRGLARAVGMARGGG
jgi:aerobic carbon-monoxide dehydrogenase medium subunit